MNIITLNRVLLNNTPLNYRRKRILTEKDFYFKTIERTFTFSKSAGGKSIKDGRAYIKRIKGNSVVWNQQVQWRGSGNIYKGLTVTYEGVKVHIQGVPEDTEIHFYSLFFDDIEALSRFQKNHYYLIRGASEHFELAVYRDVSMIGSNVITQKTGDVMRLYVRGFNLTIGQEVNESFSAQVIDLTQMFQAGNEPTTIEEYEARKPIVEDEYAYNEGKVIHCNTESIKSVGDNAWDEQWEEGYYDVNNGQKKPAENLFRSVNHFRILPNNEYYLKGTGIRILYYDANMNYIYYEIKSNGIVTSPPNACYASIFGEKTYYSTDIMVTLVHSGWKQDTDAGYQPYWQDILPLPIIRKYFPDGMKSAGTAHDEIRFNKASGKWEYSKGRIKSVDLGSLTWSYFEAYGFYATVPNNMVEGNLNYLTNLSYSKYANPDRISWTNSDKAITNGLATIGTSWVRNLVIKDSAYTDAATFKADMAGVMLYYESNDWEWVELDAEDQNFRDYYNVADFGTEQSQSAVPSAALLADVGYYFKKSEVKELTLN